MSALTKAIRKKEIFVYSVPSAHLQIDRDNLLASTTTGALMHFADHYERASIDYHKITSLPSLSLHMSLMVDVAL